MIVDSMYGGKLKDRQAEVTKLQDYFSTHVANSWRHLTSRNPRVNTFVHNNIPLAMAINNQLTTQVNGMKQYVRGQMDTLAHISWPYELSEPQDFAFSAGAGLSSDGV